MLELLINVLKIIKDDLILASADSLFVKNSLTQIYYMSHLQSTIDLQSTLITVALGVITFLVMIVFGAQFYFQHKFKKFQNEFDKFKKWKIVEDYFKGFKL